MIVNIILLFFYFFSLWIFILNTCLIIKNDKVEMYQIIHSMIVLLATAAIIIKYF